MYPTSKPPSILARIALIAMNRDPAPVSLPSAAVSPGTDELVSALEEQPSDGGDHGHDDDAIDDGDHFSCTIHGAALERRLRALLADAHARLVDDAVARVLPQLHEAADAAVVRRLGEPQPLPTPPPQLVGDDGADDDTATLVEEDRGSDAVVIAAAVRALAALEAVDPQSACGLAERVFVRRGVVALLRRLLARLEGELADREWEQL